MAKMTKDLETVRQKDVIALHLELRESQSTLQKSRVDLAFGRLPKVSEINRIRKHIARLQTVIGQKAKAAAHA